MTEESTEVSRHEVKPEAPKERIKRQVRETFGRPKSILGFDVNRELARINGPIIEVGGPTKSGYDILDNKPLNEAAPDGRVFISNITPGFPLFTVNGVTLEEGVDFAADARKLPLKDGSVSAILGSSLSTFEELPNGKIDRNIIDDIMHEAHRCLEEGGLLIMQDTYYPHIKKARKADFRLAQYKKGENKVGAVFVKTAPKVKVKNRI